MVMLSEFLRFRLTDSRRHTRRLVDVVVDLAAGDYPPVRRLVVRGGNGQTSTLGWEQVQSVDWRLRRVLVEDLS
ncbi:MAG TPA: hypothetical protein VF937_01575, partial [Chloroflexota bacterium]